MTIYSGTITGSAHLVAKGIPVTIGVSDAEVENISINPDGSFSGKLQQNITVTVTTTVLGQTFKSSSSRSFSSDVDGNVNQPIHVSETILGQNVDLVSSFSSDQSKITGSGKVEINYDGVSGPFSYQGALKRRNIVFTISGPKTVHEPIALVHGQYIASAKYTVSVSGDPNPKDVYTVNITDNTLAGGGGADYNNYMPFGTPNAPPISLTVTPAKNAQFSITVRNDRAADDIGKGSKNDGSILIAATCTGPLGADIGSSPDSVNSVLIVESKLSHMMPTLGFSELGAQAGSDAPANQATQHPAAAFGSYLAAAFTTAGAVDGGALLTEPAHWTAPPLLLTDSHAR